MSNNYKRPSIPKLNINKKFRSLEEFANIQTAIEESFGQYMAELAGQYMQDYITQKVYYEDALGGASSYERTFDLMNAVTVTKNKQGEWKVGIDGRKLHVMPAMFPEEWGQHAGINGEPVASQMATYLEYGNNSPLYNYNGIEYMESTQQYIDSILQNEWIKFKNTNNL